MWDEFKRIDWLDVILHFPLCASFLLAFALAPGIGAAWTLWNREAAQRDLPWLQAMNLTEYSMQKHMEIWVPAIALEIVWRLL